jgi:hypothetical protein
VVQEQLVEQAQAEQEQVNQVLLEELVVTVVLIMLQDLVADTHMVRHHLLAEELVVVQEP